VKYSHTTWSSRSTAPDGIGRLREEIAMFRDPYYGGVRYYDDNGNTIIEKEYPTDMFESGADALLAVSKAEAAKHGVYLYLNGSTTSEKD
jgi:hypothetical protein